MNNLITTSKQLTMNSQEIADLLECRHDSVKRTMERLADKGLITITPMVESTEGGGKPTTVYHVNKRDSYVVVAQLSPEFTARLVDRWQELEAKTTVALPANYIEALERLVISEKEKLQLIENNKQLEAQNKDIATHFNAAMGTVKNLGDVLAYQARVLEARNEDREDLLKTYRSA